MFLSKKKFAGWMRCISEGRADTSGLPELLVPYAKKFQSLIGERLSASEKAVEGARLVTHFGREGLSFGSSLDSVSGEAQQLAAATEELSASAEEIHGLGEGILERAQSASTSADEGSQALRALIDQLGQVDGSIQEVSTHTEAFVGKTKEITQLTSTVNEIADQTNLLALNAAIEAARAGEHGRGFAVVADEVRNLAKRSGEAAQQIESIVGDVVSGAQSIDSVVSRAQQLLTESHEHREQLQQTLSRSRELAAQNVDAMSEIASNTQQQSSVAQDMAQRVQETSDRIHTASESFRRISDGMVSLRDNQAAILQSFDVDSTVLLLTLAKSDHVTWVDKVIRQALHGEAALGSNELKDHTQCRLGRFLDSEEGKALSGHRRFSELYNDIHPKVHELGIAIAKGAERGSEQQLAEKVEALLTYSDSVLGILDELKEFAGIGAQRG